MIGVRKWSLNHDDDIEGFIHAIATSHWPGNSNAIPIEIQEGALLGDKAGPVRDCEENPRTYQTFGETPEYGKRMVVAHYALHRMTNCWPDHIPKPWHPPGTTLELKVRGAGQTWLVTPNVPIATSVLMDCNSGIHSNAGMGTRIVLPTPEYQISCDLMTRNQVDNAFGGNPQSQNRWDSYLGTVNGAHGTNPFLGAEVGTVLFEAYELTESFAANNASPHRYRLTGS
ncbi:MAG: hypothetical protein ACYSVY_18225, partial [Planctomycetota bacterium]